MTETLKNAVSLGAAGRFSEMQALCQHLLHSTADVPQLLDLGVLFANYGLHSDAHACYTKARSISPEDLRPLANLATLAREASEHRAARDLNDQLLKKLPDHPVIRRNALTGLEYDPQATDAERLQYARAWASWAIARAGGVRPRPAATALHARPLRIGYVSADLCQHTVGLFVKDVLKAHNTRHKKDTHFNYLNKQHSLNSCP